jgi:stage III sporulation protein SpoIIIAA
MSPQIIIADEIGGAEDIAALQFARLSGVAVIASIHAGELRDIAGKGITKSLFDYAVFLKGTTEPAAIDRIVDLGLAEACEVHT